MIAHVTMAAAVGRKLYAWARPGPPRRQALASWSAWSLLLALMLCSSSRSSVAVWPWPVRGPSTRRGARALPAGLASRRSWSRSWWFWVRIYYLPVPALMLEHVGIFGAIERGHALTRKAFWRIFGIAAAHLVITGIAGSMLGAPVS